MNKPLVCLVLPLLAACGSTPGTGEADSGFVSLLQPYRIDVRQGNFVTQQMVSQLKPGLTKDQVRFLLGTPLLTDIFHAERWDYVYRLQTGAGDIVQRRLTVFFEDGKLARVEGDVAAQAAGAATDSPKPSARAIDIAPAAPAKTPGTPDETTDPLAASPAQ